MKEIKAYIGVIGSGKDYASEKYKEDTGAVIFDFSEGVRKMAFSILRYTPISKEEYVAFKKTRHVIFDGLDNGVPKFKTMTGRELLESVGKTMRDHNPNFWADYCSTQALQHIVNDNPEHICFNAVRYPNEAKNIINLARRFKYELTFVFTNFKSSRYELRGDESEAFAQHILNLGCEHNQDITEIVKNLV